MTTTVTESEFTDTKGAARILGVHINTIRDFIKSGRLPTRRLNDSGKRSRRGGPRHRIRVEDVRALLTPEARATYEAKPPTEGAA